MDLKVFIFETKTTFSSGRLNHDGKDEVHTTTKGNLDTKGNTSGPTRKLEQGDPDRSDELRPPMTGPETTGVGWGGRRSPRHPRPPPSLRDSQTYGH